MSLASYLPDRSEVYGRFLMKLGAHLARIQAGEDTEPFNYLEAIRANIDEMVNPKVVKEQFIAARESHKAFCRKQIDTHRHEFIVETMQRSISDMDREIAWAMRPEFESEIMELAYKELG
jgi:hypothetical protein